jgi:actin-related protein
MSGGGGETFRVKFNCEARDAHSLSVKRGDLVQIVRCFQTAKKKKKKKWNLPKGALFRFGDGCAWRAIDAQCDLPSDVAPKPAAHYVRLVPDGPAGFVQAVRLFFFFFQESDTKKKKKRKKIFSNKNSFFVARGVQKVYLTSTAAPVAPASPAAAPRVAAGRAALAADARMSWSPSSANAAAIQYALKHGGAAPPADPAAPSRSNSGSAAAAIAAASGGSASRGSRGGSFIGRSSTATPPPPGSPIAAARTPAGAAAAAPTPVRSSSLTDAPAATAAGAAAAPTAGTASTRPTNLRQASSGGGGSPQIVHRSSTGATATAAPTAPAAGANVSAKKLPTAAAPAATASTATPTPTPPTNLSASLAAVGRFRPDSSAQTAALKEKLMGGGSTSNETSPRIAARKAPAPLGVAAGAVQAASQIFEQLGFAQRKLGGSAALPAAWTSSRRTSPVMTPREDFANALPDEEDSSSDGSGPLPPPLATITKLQLKGVVPTVGPKTPTSSRSTGSNGAASNNESAPAEAGDDSTGTESHSRFDVSELQELKRRLQLKKEKAETPRIKVHAIEMITDDGGDSDADSDSGADDAAPADGARRNKSKEKRRGKDRPKSKTSSSSSAASKNALSLRRRKKGSDDAGDPTAPQPPPPPSLQPPPPPADDSPRKTTSSRDRPSSRDVGSSSRSRKVRTLPRNARAAVANNDDSSDDDDHEHNNDSDGGDAGGSPPAKLNDDDIWQRLIAAEKEKQLKRERRKRAEQASNPSAVADDDEGMPLVDESNKSGSMRRKDKRRSKAPREPDAPSFDQVFAAVEDSSPADSPRVVTTAPDDFDSFFQEEPEAARGVQFSEGTKADSASSTSVTTRARSRSVTERIGIAKLGLQPVTLGAIKEKSKSKADPEADVAAIAAAAAAATLASNEVTLGGGAVKPAAAPVAAAAASATTAATNLSGKQPNDRPKVCQLCLARSVETPGKVAARVVTPDGVELFLCKPCTLEYQSRDGAGPLPMPSSAATAGMNRGSSSGASTAAAAAAAAAALSASGASATTTASRLSTSSTAAAAAAPAVAAAATASPLVNSTTAAAAEEDGGGMGKNRFSFTRLKTRLSGRYKLQRDAEGNVITVDRVAGVTGGGGGGESGSSTPEPARRGSNAASNVPSGALGRNSRRQDDDDDGDVGVDVASSNRLRRELAAVQTRAAIGFDIGRRTDDIVVVIDPGSATTKVGFSGEAAPRAVMPTWVRYMEAPKKVPAGMFGQPVMPIAEGTLPDRPGFIGEDPSVPKLRSHWKHPVERGVVRDWDEMEKILEYSFDFELKADPEDHPVIMTDGSPLSDRLQRERAVQIMFETFNVPSTYLALQSAMSLLACGQLTGLVVTIGDGVTCAVPIYEGFPMRHSIHTLDRAGADLTTHMVDLVNDAMQATDEWAKLAPGETEQLLFDSTSHSDRYQFEQLKRKYCYVARQSVVAEEKLASESRYKFEKQWTTLDGRRLPLLHERYLACEPLFAPSRIGGAEMHWLDETGTSTERRHVNCEGIHRLAYASVRKCDKSVRKTLLQNVYLAGGSSRIDGLTERMAEELKSLLVGTHLAKAKVSVAGGVASDEYSEWVGASMFASLSAFASTAISKDEYLEVGPTVVHRRCL